MCGKIKGLPPKVIVIFRAKKALLIYW